MKFLGLLSCIFHFLILHCCFSAQATELPYSQRSRPYNGVNSTVRGDTRTVGMAGATLGLGDTFLAAKDNPAGLAMTMKTGDDNFTKTHVHDANVQNFDHPIDTFNAGLALNIHPWGFSLGYLRPYREQDHYSLASQSDRLALMGITIEELRIAAARVFLQNKLAVGLSLNIGWAKRKIEFEDDPATKVENTATSVGVTLGTTYQFPHRFLVGASVSTPMNYEGNGNVDAKSILPGFFQQPIQQAWLSGVGLAWIPNRFFRSDFSVFGFGRTKNTALLKDETKTVGEAFTLQPRMGLAYVFSDFKYLKATFFLGAYYETSRINDASSRFHQTWGVEVKPWIFTVGIGLDSAPGYQNGFASLNVDIFKAMAQLNLIPMDETPKNGFFANPVFETDMGLPATLVQDPKSDTYTIDAISTGLDIPKKVKEGAVNDAIKGATQLPEKIKEEVESMKKAQKRRLNRDESKSKPDQPKQPKAKVKKSKPVRR